jgi:hypothetical protein
VTSPGPADATGIATDAAPSSSAEPARICTNPLDVGSLLASASSDDARRRAGAGPAGSPTAIEAIDFALGLMDVVTCLCSALIGLRVVAPDALQDDLKKRVAWWHAKGNIERAAASQLVLDRLQLVEKSQRESVAHVVNPTTLPKGLN